MSRRKALPLVSSNWLPLKDAFARLRQRLGSATPAEQDLNAAFRSGVLRTKLRRPVGDQGGELLPPAFWNDHKFDWVGFDDGVRLSSAEFSELKVPPQGWVYVWQPDFKKICGGEVAPAAETEETSKPPVKMGTPLQHDVVEITLEIAWRLYHEKQIPGKRGREKLAAAISDWCERRFRKTPGDKYLLKIIAAAMHRFD